MDAGNGLSALLERTAMTTPRSIAGSSICIPPVILRKTSLVPNLNPTFFSNTANSMLSRLLLNPVADR